MTQLIRGKVAKVLNAREIVINAGTTDGVTVGTYFDVMDIHGEEIRDPDTNEVLGSLERPKVRVRVTYAQENLSVATTPRSNGVNTDFVVGLADLAIPTLGPVARSLIGTPQKPYAQLQKAAETTDELDEEDSRVQIGDPVVQVLETGKTE